MLNQSKLSLAKYAKRKDCIVEFHNNNEKNATQMDVYANQMLITDPEPFGWF